jgi:hypothetical protein
MDASARAEAFERLANFVMENRRAFYKATRGFTQLNPEDLLQTVFSKALGILSREQTRSELEQRLAGMLKPSYWYVALRNASHDEHDRTRWEIATEETPEDGGTYHPLPGDPTAEDTTDWVTEQVGNRAFGNAVRALVDPDRAVPNTADQLRHPHLTAEQWRVLQVLSTLTQRGHQVYGIQADLARELGFARSTVSQHLRSILTMLQLTRYVAGELGPARTLQSQAEIAKALAAYDRWIAPQQKPTVVLVRDLARSVRTDANFGTRARLDALPALPPEGDAERAAVVHRQETDCAEALGTCYPNCAACCPTHNLTPDRTTEF